MKKYSVILVFLLLCATAAFGQALTSYSCDFEDAAELAQWTRNAGTRGATGANKWYIGAAGSFGVSGTQGMYISCGTDLDTLQRSYKAASYSCFQVAYRPMTLVAGTYTIMFDGICKGKETDKIMVFWVDATQNTNSNNSTSTLAEPSWVPANRVECRGTSSWKSCTGQFTTTGTPGKLVVMWYNASGTVVNPAGGIDNIRIYQGTPLAAPSGLNYKDASQTLSWRGTASTYDVVMYNSITGHTIPYTGVTGTSQVLSDLDEEGMYFFYVRATDATGRASAWISMQKFVWIKGKRCIDFLDLTADNSGTAKCFTGGWEEAGYTGTGVTEHLKDNAGMVCSTYDDEQSLHAIQYIPGETDARTGGQLATIPDGEIASIRLGGLWDMTGNKTSTIEYAYTVNSGQNDLLILQYACVLEYVDYHPEHVEPRFKLEILGANGQPIDMCSQADFKAGFGDTQRWHAYQYAQNGGTYTCDVRWCDWEKITVSLRNYIGQTLTIRLTAYSCAQSAHFGYAYFTLNCESGELEGIACGDFSTDHFEAPDGFDYRWYKASDKRSTVLSRDQIFNIDRQDTTIYLVDLVSKLHNNCFYTLTANPNPRFPEAEALAVPESKDCQNTVTFYNTSHVVYVNRLDSTRTISEEALGSVVWDFGDGERTADFSKVLTHVYPQEGGEFDVICRVGMSDDVCLDDTVIHLSLPNILESHQDDTLHVCGTEHTDSHGVKHYAADSTYYIDDLGMVVNPYGCEAPKLRYVFFHPTYDTLYTVRICEGTKYTWPANGQVYTATTQTSHNVPTAFGCDSIMRLNLIVDPALRVRYDDTVRVCYDSASMYIDYEVLSGSIDSVFVYFSEEAQASGFDAVYKFAMGDALIIPLPKTGALQPGNHQASLYFNGEFCSLDPLNICVQIQYSAAIAMVTDGFIGVQNVNYNGGHNFAEFQWFRNGAEVSGADQSYIPVTRADVGAVYTVRLRREGENYTIFSCPILFRLWTGMDEIGADEPVEVYTLLGASVASYNSLNEALHRLPLGAYVVRGNNNLTQTVIVR